MSENTNDGLRKLFPKLSEQELEEVGETFHGYLEIAWRIFQRMEAERKEKEQKNRGQSEFESPRGSALF
jgi:hypothetical protein